MCVPDRTHGHTYARTHAHTPGFVCLLTTVIHLYTGRSKFFVTKTMRITYHTSAQHEILIILYVIICVCVYYIYII